MKLTIISIGKENVQADDTNLLAVKFKITEEKDGKEVLLAERVIGLKPDTNEEELKVALQKYLDVYKDDIEIGKKSEKVGKENKNIEKLSEKFTGLTIK